MFKIILFVIFSFLFFNITEASFNYEYQKKYDFVFKQNKNKTDLYYKNNFLYSWNNSITCDKLNGEGLLATKTCIIDEFNPEYIGRNWYSFEYFNSNQKQQFLVNTKYNTIFPYYSDLILQKEFGKNGIYYLNITNGYADTLSGPNIIFMKNNGIANQIFIENIKDYEIKKIELLTGMRIKLFYQFNNNILSRILKL